jgi:hypothetical protein
MNALRRLRCKDIGVDVVYNDNANPNTCFIRNWLNEDIFAIEVLGDDIMRLIEGYFIQHQIGCGDYNTQDLLEIWNEPATDMIADFVIFDWGKDAPELVGVDWSLIAADWLEEKFIRFKDTREELWDCND